MIWHIFSRIFTLMSVILSLYTVPAITDSPNGWFLAGSNPDAYEVGKTSPGGDSLAAYLKSIATDPTGFGTLMQSFAADSYLGRRLRLSGRVKSKDVTGWSGLWMRVDGPCDKRLAFDNMQSRPIVGTTDANTYEVVLDVPKESELIAFGVLLVGGGEVILDDISFEVVDESVSVTSFANPEPLNVALEK